MTRALEVFFLVGLAGLLVRRDTKSPRFFTVVYIASAVAILILLNLIPLYPFGNPRYAFFFFFPVALVATYGVADLAETAARLLPFLRRPLFLRASVAALCVLGLYLGFEEALRRMEAGDRAIAITGMIQDDYDLVIVESRYANLLRFAARGRQRKVIIIYPDGTPQDPAQFKESVETLRRRGAQRVLTVSRDIGAWPADLASALHGYEKVRHLQLHPDGRYREVFHKYDIHAAVLSPGDPRSLAISL